MTNADHKAVGVPPSVLAGPLYKLLDANIIIQR